MTLIVSENVICPFGQKLHATKYHRMWIIDDKKKPIGVCLFVVHCWNETDYGVDGICVSQVLALTDIFKYICKKKEN